MDGASPLRNENYAPDPYRCLGGMGDNDDPASPVDVAVAHRSGDIRHITERRLQQDPLQNVRARRGFAASEYDRLMAFIEEVGGSVGFPDSDSDPTWALIVRVCAVAEHLFPPIHSESLN